MTNSAITASVVDLAVDSEASRVMLGTDPSVLTGDQLPKLTWGPPDEAGLVQFLVEEKSFSEDRIRKAVERIKASHGKSTQGKPFAMVTRRARS